MSSSPKAPKINWLVCMGDSITNDDWANAFIPKTQQYPKVVQKMIGGNCREKNLGVPGNTTTQMLARMKDFLQTVPTVATIYGGINDQLNSISTTTMTSNIQSMIDQLKAAGCTRIIICNIHNIPGTSGGSDGNFSAYRTALQNLATTNNLPFCDFHAVTLINPTDYYTDIIHPSASGRAKLASQLKATLDAQGWTSYLQN
jgi:lysophospholipase L1-like esterase